MPFLCTDLLTQQVLRCAGEKENDMKRSEINKALKRMESVINDLRISLPPFCGFTPEEWRSKGHEYDEIRDNMLGWDITDYGLGDFNKVGFSLITLRNGNLKAGDKYPKPYAEKLLFIEEGQYSPNHFHWNKMEDIINRGGADLLVKVYMADENEGLSDRDVPVTMDGVTRYYPAGSIVRVHPGESITMQRYLYHEFWADGDIAMVGEVSMVNDDSKDNRFYVPNGRFADIEEDEPAEYLLCNEYPEAK